MKAICEIVKFDVSDVVTTSTPVCDPVSACEDEF